MSQRLRPRLARIVLYVALAATALPCGAQARSIAAHSAQTGGRIALTFDDLPAIALTKDEAYVEDINRRLLAGLKRHHLPATGFVNEYKLDEMIRPRQIAILKAWLNAGMDLGNHTFSHESPNDIGVKAYIDDIANGEMVTKKLLAARGRRDRWFRAPNLETGHPMAAKQEILGWLATHGYRMAPVTMNATDWQFAEPYDDAVLHHDTARAARIRASYLAYTREMIGWYHDASAALFGRDIAYVMLLHTSRLNADCIDDLATLFRRAKLRPVNLDTAMRDPAYRTPDRFAEADGIDWMERWAETLNKTLPWDSFHDVPKDIQNEYDKVDKDRSPSDAGQ